MSQKLRLFEGMKRTAMQDQLFTKIVEEVANSKGRLEWALPAGTVMNQLGTTDATEGHPWGRSTTRAGRLHAENDDPRLRSVHQAPYPAPKATNGSEQR